MLSIPGAGGWWTFCAVAMGLFHATAWAAPAPPDSIEVVTGPLTLGRALALAGRHDPRLQASGLRTEAARSRIGDANRHPNPTLIATEENFGGDLGGSRREATLALGQVFELGGDRAARTATAEADAALAHADADLTGRDLGTQTIERFLVAWSLQARLGRLREGERLARDAIDAAQARHRAGATPALEVLRAQGRATAQAIERQRAESELGVARRELALGWGANEVTFDTLVAPTIPSGESRTHPELTRAKAIEATAAARIRAAEAARSPDLTLTAGVRRLEEAGGAGFVVGVEWPLPLWGPGSGHVAAAQLELAAASLERRATEQRLQVALLAATERVRAASDLLDTLRLHALPARAQVVDELMRGYRAGRSSYLDLVAEQANLLETELQLIDAQVDFWHAQFRVQFMTGEI